MSSRQFQNSRSRSRSQSRSRSSFSSSTRSPDYNSSIPPNTITGTCASLMSSSSSIRSPRQSRRDSVIRTSSSASSPRSTNVSTGRSYICTARSRSLPASKRSIRGGRSIRSIKKRFQPPISEFKRVRDLKTKHEIRNFMKDFTDNDQFEVFTMTVDSIPFVGVSLANADGALKRKYCKVPPPTPMKPSTGMNSPRKRSLSSIGTGTSTDRRNKSVRFHDEEDGELSPGSAKLSKGIMRAVGNNEKEYSNLWEDRMN